MSYTTVGHLENIATLKLNAEALTKLIEAYSYDLVLYKHYWSKIETLDTVIYAASDPEAWSNSCTITRIDFDTWSHEELALLCLVTRDVYVVEGKIDGDMNEAQKRLNLFRGLISHYA